MAVRKVAVMGHPILLRRADRVDDPTDPEVPRVVADVRDTVEDCGASGIGNPQVFASLQREVDRLDGILFTMRMRDLPTLSFNSTPGFLAEDVETRGDIDPLLTTLTAAWPM